MGTVSRSGDQGRDTDLGFLGKQVLKRQTPADGCMRHSCSCVTAKRSTRAAYCGQWWLGSSDVDATIRPAGGRQTTQRHVTSVAGKR